MDARDEMIGVMHRITADFRAVLPGLRLELVSPEAFAARLAAKPLLPGQEDPGGEAREEGPLADPVRAHPSSLTVMVEMERLLEMVEGEEQRLRRPLVEGLVLREVLYLITCRQPLPQPRARAEDILRRHWPFQYTVLRCLGMTAAGPLDHEQIYRASRDN